MSTKMLPKLAPHISMMDRGCLCLYSLYSASICRCLCWEHLGQFLVTSVLEPLLFCQDVQPAHDRKKRRKNIEMRKLHIAFKRPAVKRTILKLFLPSLVRFLDNGVFHPSIFCSSLTLPFQQLHLLSCCLLLPLFHHLGQLLLGTAPSTHVH